MIDPKLFLCLTVSAFFVIIITLIILFVLLGESGSKHIPKKGKFDESNGYKDLTKDDNK